MPRQTDYKRPGQFIKRYLLTQGTAAISQIHQAYKADIDVNNEGRERCDRLLKPTYASFYQYFRHFVFLGLVEMVGEEDIRAKRRFDLPHYLRSPEKMGFAETVNGKWKVHRGAVRRLWRLTPRGEAAVEAWSDPLKARGYYPR